MDIMFYQTEMNSVPVQDFIDGLSAKQKGYVYALLDYFQAVGFAIRSPKAKKVRDEIFELRCEVRTDEFRILYAYYDGCAVCLHGFQKRTDKIKESDIEKAKQRFSDYQLHKKGVGYVRG